MSHWENQGPLVYVDILIQMTLLQTEEGEDACTTLNTLKKL